jgi:TetR/AcrR family transcriptional repressor of lmrAB and yxaGH operons
VPAPLLSRHEVVDRLMTVFRREGFAGASLTQLSRVTGLGKSSLYHYFPAGKEDMTRAVLERLAERFRADLFDRLRAGGKPRTRIDAMIGALDAFYRGGRETCLLASMVVGDTRERFRRELSAILEEWVTSLAGVLQDAGYTPAQARTRAEDAVIRVEGALILANGSGRFGVFERTLKQLPRDLLG